MILLLDSHAIMGLCKGEAFELRQRLATCEEVVTQGQGLPGAAELARAARDRVITEDPSPQSRARLPRDRGRRAGMRQLAASRNLAVLTVPELLLVAKLAGHLLAVKPGIAQVSYDETLRMAGET
ncbi:MAG: hypothetical protein AB1758_13195 [Candidatus Eremiobacterota bacterium]